MADAVHLDVAHDGARDAVSRDRGTAIEPHDRPVAQHLPDVPGAADRQIHAVRTAQNFVEFQRGFANLRVIHDLEKASRVRHQGTIEKRLIRLEQIHQVNETFEVVGFLAAALKRSFYPAVIPGGLCGSAARL
jgi:hypothetical protein